MAGHGWFLGPMAENKDELIEMVVTILQRYVDLRTTYQSTEKCLTSTDFVSVFRRKHELENLKSELMKMNKRLEESVPFYSSRYKGHMNWEVTLPSLLGYFSGMLWNQNNVDSSASPVTTEFEITVGEQLCDLLGFQKDQSFRPWGHITSCGTIANIEALWAARNLKYQPIALQNAVTVDQRLIQAKLSFKIHVPHLQKKILLVNASTWDLLNLDVDEVCKMAESVAMAAGVTMTTLAHMMEGFAENSVGILEFAKYNNLQKTPVFLSPSTGHYSWPKAAGLLGFGNANANSIPVDAYGRQNMRELERRLNECLEDKIPVICVVAIVGSTRESAVDSVEEIVKLRQKFRRKGLNFCIHADAAWAGYLMSMLREPCINNTQRALKSLLSDPANTEENEKEQLNEKNLLSQLAEDLQSVITKEKYGRLPKCLEDEGNSVPTIPLSSYVESQFQAIKDVDTVTIDPHKAGFCLYPSGALCYRNGRMRGFITLAAPEVFHSENDPSVGVYGLEGSKPGAAACSVLLSHQVIGLDKLGYGQILGQCQFGAKLFYCMLMTVAKEDDPFICCNFIDIRSKGVANSKKFINERILGKTNKEIAKDKDAMQFLSDIGPDALVNAFAVNMKNEDGTLNKDITIFNQLQTDIFQELSGHGSMSIKRTPMFLTSSIFKATQYGQTLEQFKNRLGLSDDDTKAKPDVKFLRSTSMNPFVCSKKCMGRIGQIFRNTVLNCIGKFIDQPSIHRFVCCKIGFDDTVLIANIPALSQTEFQYQVILKIKLLDALWAEKLRFLQSSSNNRQTIFLFTGQKITMFELIHSKCALYLGLDSQVEPNNNDTCTDSIPCILEDVVQYKNLDSKESNARQQVSQGYFLFGDGTNAYLLRLITRSPDFFQLVCLDEIPANVPQNILEIGAEVMVLGLPIRSSTSLHLQCLMQCKSYTIKFDNIPGLPKTAVIKTKQKNAEMYFLEL